MRLWRLHFPDPTWLNDYLSASNGNDVIGTALRFEHTLLFPVSWYRRQISGLCPNCRRYNRNPQDRVEFGLETWLDLIPVI